MRSKIGFWKLVSLVLPFVVMAAGATSYELATGNTANDTNASTITGAPVPLASGDQFTVANGAYIDIGAAPGDAYAIQGSDHNTINNLGEISLSGQDGNLFGIAIGADSTATNLGSISVSLKSTVASTDWKAVGMGVLTSGTNSEISNTGQVNVKAEAQADGANAQAYGMLIQNLANDGSLSNSGDIHVEAAAASGVTAGDVFAHGMRTYGSMPVTMVNTGTITVRAAAENATNIIAVGMDVVGNNIKVQNRGCIRVEVSGNASDRTLAAGIFVRANRDRIVDNWGCIEAKGKNSYGILFKNHIGPNTLNLYSGSQVTGETADLGFQVPFSPVKVNLIGPDRWHLTYDGPAPDVELKEAPGALLVHKHDPDNHLDGNAGGLITTVSVPGLALVSSLPSVVQVATASQATDTTRRVAAVAASAYAAGASSAKTASPLALQKRYAYLTWIGGGLTKGQSAAGFNGIYDGSVAGVGVSLNDWLQVGGFFAYTRSMHQRNDEGWTVRASGFSVGVNTTAQFGSADAHLAFSYGYYPANINQRVGGVGNVKGSLGQSYIYPSAELGFSIAGFRPFAELGYVMVSQGEYKDDGGLEVNPRSAGVLRGGLGVGFTYQIIRARLGLAFQKRVSGGKADLTLEGQEFQNVSLPNFVDEYFGYVNFTAMQKINDVFNAFASGSMTVGGEPRFGVDAVMGVQASF